MSCDNDALALDVSYEMGELFGMKWFTAPILGFLVEALREPGLVYLKSCRVESI